MSDRASIPVRAVVTPGSDTRRPASPTSQFAEYAATEEEHASISCPRCRAAAVPGTRFCRECGAALGVSSGQVFASTQGEGGLRCQRCNAERDPGTAFCRFCGASFEEQGPRYTPAQAVVPPVTAGAPAIARIVTLLKDGSEGRSIPLAGRDMDIGNSEGDVTFADDPYMSSRHARVSFRDGAYHVRDLDSVNGVYVRLREEVELRDRDFVLVGQQVLRFEVLTEGELSLGPAFQAGVLVFGTPEVPRFARLLQYTTEGVGRDTHYLFRDETVIGRENGDIVFTDDPFLSRRHAAIRVDQAGRRFTVHDLGSSNGTALRIRGEHVLRDGDQFRIGRHLFRFEAGAHSDARPDVMGGRAGR